MVLAIKAGTVGQIRPDTHQGSVHQPVHVKDLRLLIGPLQDGLDGDLVQAALWFVILLIYLNLSKFSGSHLNLSKFSNAPFFGRRRPLHNIELPGRPRWTCPSGPPRALA